MIRLSQFRKFDSRIRINNLNSMKKTPYDKWPDEWKTIYYKAYPRLDQVVLPIPSEKKFDLYTALMIRESCRDFSNKPLDSQLLSDFLYYSCGIKKPLSDKRMYPSAGGRYPLEVYPFVFKVNKINEGVYHYHFKTHSLESILSDHVYNQAMKHFNQEWIGKSSLLLVVSAVFDRTEIKYGDRGYRHILTEYGHMAQNFYLVGNALGLGLCSIGGFVDTGLNEMLDVDGRQESVIGVVAVGNKL